MQLIDIPEIGGKLWIRDETDCWGLIQNGEYEPEETKLIKSLVKSNDVCLDIGANIGYYTVLMAKLGDKVFAFEPEPSNFGMLKLNVKINDLELKTELFEFAVTDYNTEHKLYLCDASHGMHRMFKSKHCDKSIDVEPITLELCHELDDVQIDFIKIDTEGTELDVIRGMYELLDENKPTMLIEFHPPTLLEYGVNPKEEYDFLIEKGYDIRLVPNIDQTISYQDLYDATNNESGGQNILCLKK